MLQQPQKGGQPVAEGSTFSLIMHPLPGGSTYILATQVTWGGGGEEGGLLASGTPSIVASVCGRG